MENLSMILAAAEEDDSFSLLSLKTCLGEPPRRFAQSIQISPPHLHFNSSHVKPSWSHSNLNKPPTIKPNEQTREKLFIHTFSGFEFNFSIPSQYFLTQSGKHSFFQKLTGVAHVCCKSAKSSSNLKAFSRKPHSSPSKRS